MHRLVHEVSEAHVPVCNSVFKSEQETMLIRQLLMLSWKLFWAYSGFLNQHGGHPGGVSRLLL
jgi:hypothetical protein